MNCGPMLPESDSPDTTLDAVLGGRLRLRQKRKGHRFGHDAILLAAATGAQAGQHVVELGSGVGAAGLALAARVPGLRLTLIEIDPELAALAAENAVRNGFGEVRVLALDVGAAPDVFAAAGLTPGAADGVLMNPPFNDTARQQVSPDRGRSLAHAGPADLLNGWIGTAARLLRDGGTLTLIWRADGLVDVMAALEGGFGAVAVMPVYPKPGAPPIRVLVRAQKGGPAASTTLPGLALNDVNGTGGNGTPSAAAEAVLRRGEALPLASLPTP
jgi:tRNA1(Val) A37 N6-methylase TrmN6